MLYCLICQDKENAIETRMQNREDHLKYVAETNVVKSVSYTHLTLPTILLV